MSAASPLAEAAPDIEPAPGGRPAEEPARIAELDGLRGLAILSVLAWHYLAGRLGPALGSVGSLADRLLALAWSGVDLFFVLSGFLIGGILMAHRDSPRYFRTFYLRRACRILPAYAVVVASAFAWAALAAGGTVREVAFDPLLPAWSYATFTQNLVMAVMDSLGSHWLAATWSLAVEEQFYLLLPLVVWIVAPRWLPHALVTLILSAPLLRLALLSMYSNGGFVSYLLMPCRADALLTGVLLAWAWRRRGFRAALAVSSRSLHAAFAVLAAGAALLLAYGGGVWSYRMASVGYSWLALLYASMLVIVLAIARGPLSALSRWRWLGALGRISYTVYLLHQPVLRLAYGLVLDRRPALDGLDTALVMGLAVVATLGLAALSWRFFERPIVGWGHAFRY